MPRRSRSSIIRGCRRGPHGRHLGQSLILNANAPNLGSMYIMLNRSTNGTMPDLSADAIAAEDARTLPGKDEGGRRSHFRRPPRRRPGHHRRLQDDHRGSRQPRHGRTAAHQRRDRQEGQQRRHRADRPGHSSRSNTPWLYLDIDRDQVQGPGHQRQRRLQHAAGLHRLLLRQQLQRVRPHLAGQRPGRPEIPHKVSDIGQLQVRNAKGRWSASAPCSKCARTLPAR